MLEIATRDPVAITLSHIELFEAYTKERLFGNILGSQVALLVFLESRSAPADIEAMKPFHELYKQFVGSDNYSVADWLNFLVRWGVVEKVGDPYNVQLYTITKSGKEFLAYIRANYPYIWDKRNA